MRTSSTAGSSHQVFAKALSLCAGGAAKAAASSVRSPVMPVRLVRIAERTDAHATFPAAREVVALLVVCALYTWLVGHAWELMAAAFADLSAIWRTWSAASPVRVDEADIGGLAGLEVLLPMFPSTTVCLLLDDMAAIMTKLICWDRGIQLYFLVTMSPIPLSPFGLGETRRMDVRFLRTYCSLVLGYASLAFAMDAFPSLTAMAVEASWQAGGVKEMVPSIMASCVLQVWRGPSPRRLGARPHGRVMEVPRGQQAPAGPSPHRRT